MKRGEIEMNKTIWIAWAIRGSVTILAFAGLAVWFNHWWIVLFAALFLPSIETRSEGGSEEGG